MHVRDFAEAIKRGEPYLELANVSHIVRLLAPQNFIFSPPRKEFTYNCITFEIPYAVKAQPSWKIPKELAARLAYWYGSPEQGNDAGLYEWTSERAKPIVAAIEKYAASRGGDDSPPPEPVLQNIAPHPILGHMTAMSPELKAIIGGAEKDAALSFFSDPRVRARAAGARRSPPPGM